MAKLYDLKELMGETGLSERTLRYYLAEVVDAPGGTPGRKAYYPQEVLDRLQVARRVLQGDYDPKRGEVKPSLQAFREWLATLSPEEVREMAEMPYRIKPKQLVSYEASLSRQRKPRRDSRAKKRASKDYDAAPAEMHRIESQRIESLDMNAPRRMEDKAASNESAADYLDRVAGPKQPPKPKPGPWRRYRFGDEIEIKTRKRLTRAQERQLRMAGKLLQSMLEEG